MAITAYDLSMMAMVPFLLRSLTHHPVPTVALNTTTITTVATAEHQLESTSK